MQSKEARYQERKTGSLAEFGVSFQLFDDLKPPFQSRFFCFSWALSRLVIWLIPMADESSVKTAKVKSPTGTDVEKEVEFSCF